MGPTYDIVEGLDTVRSRQHRGFAMRWKAGQHEGVLNKDGYKEYAEGQDYPMVVARSHQHPEILRVRERIHWPDSGRSGRRRLDMYSEWWCGSLCAPA